ncbi:hypothetical protein BDR06DRAFT_961704 [Suillus hirtellus]|nr:hypothetical protein BDR06DRAFT_961704 [Suillus hirtellus]
MSRRISSLWNRLEGPSKDYPELLGLISLRVIPRENHDGSRRCQKKKGSGSKVLEVATLLSDFLITER